MFVNNETILFTKSDIQHQILTRSTDMLCPSTDYQLKITYGYWIGGVVAPCIELIGLVLNSIAVQILATRNSMKNTFNNLLISLFCFDNLYLTIQAIQSLEIQLEKRLLNHDWITMLVPYFLMPMESISMTASILMTVGVAHERYNAIKHPIRHRQSMTSGRVRRNRLTKYIVLVILCSFAINLTKFFEIEIAHSNETNMNR